MAFLLRLRRSTRPVTDRRLRRRRSVLISLAALAILPSIGLPVLANMVTGHLHDSSRAARRIGDTMELVVDLQDLHAAVADESTTSATLALSVRFGLTPAQMEELIGDGVLVPLPAARARVDAALEAIVRDEHTRAPVAAVVDQVERARRSTDATEEVAKADEAGWDLYVGYADVKNQVQAIKEDAMDRIVTGDLGPASAPLLKAISRTEQLLDAVDQGIEQGLLLHGVTAAINQEDKAELMWDLAVATSAFERSSRDMENFMSPTVRAAWVELSGSDTAELYHSEIDRLVALGPTIDLLALNSPDLSEAILVFHTELRALVERSAAESLEVAEADAASAERRAEIASVATIAVLLATATLLVAIGGSLRRHLRNLATSAERFRAGHLEDVPVGGPREVALAGSALNDAVAGFRRVAMQAERLSAGDLDAPELREPAPGALGQALHTSVGQIVEAVKERERLQAELVHQAAHDDLTRLPNRAETERLLEKALARSLRSDSRIAVLFIDLDHFKRCNDIFGHAAGDHVLRTAAARMIEVVRPGDTVCRLGGDEFVVVVEPVGTDRSVVEIAERIVSSLAEPIAFGDHTIEVGASVGVAISDATTDADLLLREADSAMYQAKATERGTVGIFDEQLRAQLHEENDFRVAMTRALVRDELELHYQPVLDIGRQRVKGFEALARWNRPGHGRVAPDQFIPMAEQSGLIIDIGRWALQTATNQLAAWTAADPAYGQMQVAVNLSGRHLAQAGVVDDVRAALAGSGIEPWRLIIEITESIAIDTPVSVGHLAQLAELGVHIALDDFGTGYTSIGQLLQLPVQILKIDRSLVSGTDSDGGTAVLNRSSRIIDLIVEVAHSLGLDVVAEGVEELPQLDRLADASCDSAQGYLFSRPLPVDQVPAWVRSHTDEHQPETLAVRPT